MVSAAERYARILNAFSPLISSRSAISPSTCAIARVIHARARGARCVKSSRRAPPAASAARIAGCARPAGRSRTGSRRRRRRRPWRPSRPAARRARDEVVDGRRGHARRQPLAVVPLLGDARGRRRPSRRATSASRIARGGVADALEAVEDVPVAVDVLLGDLPVVGARVARLARVAEHDAAFELAQVHVERHAVDAVDLELQRGDAAVERRAGSPAVRWAR